MLKKSLLLAGIAFGAIAAPVVAAHAASNGSVMTCRPHDWNAFGEAVENQDNDALRAMLSQPELGGCDAILNTVRALVCAADPLSCIEPGAGPDPDDDPQDDPDDDPQDDPNDNPTTEPGDGPFPNQRPGEPYGGPGGDNDGPNNPGPGDPGDGGGDEGGDGGGDQGGNDAPTRSEPSTDNSNF